MPTKPMNPMERITRNVVISERGCWLWQLSKDKPGYGRMKIQLGSREQFRFTSAHRRAWELWKGEIPDGLNVLHDCDTPSCCNPEHLFLGTQQDNMKDMHAKGRGPKGYKRNSETCAANASKRLDAAISRARG